VVFSVTFWKVFLKKTKKLVFFKGIALVTVTFIRISQNSPQILKNALAQKKVFWYTYQRYCGIVVYTLGLTVLLEER